MKQALTAEMLDTSTGLVEELKFYNGEVTLYYDAGLHAYYLIDEDGIRYLVPGATTVCGVIDKSGPLTGWAARETCEYAKQNIDSIVRQRIESEVPFEDLLVIDRTAFERLMDAAKANYRSISKDATDVGHDAHNWLERWLRHLINLNCDATVGRFEDNVPYVEAVFDEYGPVVDVEKIADRAWCDNLETIPLPEEARARNCVEAAVGWLTAHRFKPLQSERKIFSRTLGYSGTLDWIGMITSCGDPHCCPFSGTHKELGDFKSSKNLYDEYRAQVAAYKYAWEEEHPDQPVDGRRLLRLGKDDGAFESIYMPNDTFDADMEGFYGALRVYYWLEQLKLDRKYDKSVERAIKKAQKLDRPVRKPRLKSLPTITIEAA